MSPTPQQILCSCGKSYWPQQAWIHEKCSALARVTVNDKSAINGGVANTESVVNKIESSAAVSRQVAWQQANRERYNEKMRKAMKARRERARAGFPA